MPASLFTVQVVSSPKKKKIPVQNKKIQSISSWENTGISCMYLFSLKMAYKNSSNFGPGHFKGNCCSEVCHWCPGNV